MQALRKEWMIRVIKHSASPNLGKLCSRDNKHPFVLAHQGHEEVHLHRTHIKNDNWLQMKQPLDGRMMAIAPGARLGLHCQREPSY